ncbi:F24B9.23 [Arabidopsis thaliana]|uniref:F24B9.23 n=2 Tax=Arabidopsis thaliana TaxID=3702 RepID=Q9LQP3_ARATH|nr:uncharacterized protein AT1G07680 [Arabidopsis thaliana]AAF75087.1 F24B9.23 [Arabidopsis thaliana]AAX23734.1 hypothetical protein At1g07680 [Arabidopsis thaliana]AAZ52673.1 hypothetical protein At1g07680 [Arabidopsis thaliana]AEE28161.1 transmembrane protein [Arabidopsis thaliana]VYS45328.1 unnamed protein product [Arabidopsis thaliana]|eukprot:NP_172247.2 transmembrane protein [Arabidopsis thaliana]
MFSLRTLVVLLLFTLIAIVGSINGEPGCDSSSSPTWEDLHDEQARQSLDNADKFGRITLNCETTVGGGNGGNNGFVTIIDLAVGLFFLILVAIGIWFCCVRRQKVMNAAIVQSYPGQLGAKEMGYGMDGKTKTVAMTMSAPAGKLSNGDTNV